MTYQDDSKAPEVAGLIVTLLAGSQGSVKHLRGCIGQGEAGRQHPTLHLWLQPGKPKVDHLELGILSSGVKQEVLRLEVPVDDLEGVEVGESRDDLSCVELGSGRADNTISEVRCQCWRSNEQSNINN